jgi:serine/threonine protein kinase
MPSRVVTEREDLRAGVAIAGRYTLERRIGVGGMGEVWAGVDDATGARVALKLLHPGLAGAPADQREGRQKRLLREARAARAVKHPHVVEILDVVQLADGAPVLVMELLEGESLEATLEREGALPVGQACAVMLPVVEAVSAAHTLGIVHRDLKPENVFLARVGDHVTVKVLDFGVAKLTAAQGEAAGTEGLTRSGALLGTPYYMSPEQIFGEADIDARSDIWSLGIILHQVLRGELPTRGDNLGQVIKRIMATGIPPLGEVAPETPAEIAELVGRMLSQRREDRPPDLREVTAVLARHRGAPLGPGGRSGGAVRRN